MRWLWKVTDAATNIERSGEARVAVEAQMAAAAAYNELQPSDSTTATITDNYTKVSYYYRQSRKRRYMMVWDKVTGA
jgi:hypothetical protein